MHVARIFDRPYTNVDQLLKLEIQSKISNILKCSSFSEMNFS